MRASLLISAVVFALLAIACGGDDDGGATVGPTVQPVPTDGWFGFDAPTGCVSLQFPPNWSLTTEGDVDEGGSQDCPGGDGIRNEVSDCTPATVGVVLPIVRAELPTADTGSGLAGWVELHGAVKRCDTLTNHFRMMIIATDGTLVEGPHGEIDGHIADCGSGKRGIEDQTFDVRTCVAEIDGKLYLLTRAWDTTRAAELEPVAETIAASLTIDPVN